MTFTKIYNDALLDAREIADEVEQYGHDDPMRLIHERAYSRGIETYFATAFEMVDALRGDGNLFEQAEFAADEALYGLQVNFSNWVHQIAYEGYRLLMIEHIERMGVEL